MRSRAIELVEQRNVKPEVRGQIPEFRVGDTVRVHTKISEGDKERIQIFEGVVIRKKRGHVSTTFTVRKMSYGVGVERIFPLYSPRIDRIEIMSSGRVKRARLFYLRELQGKAARHKRAEEGGAARKRAREGARVQLTELLFQKVKDLPADGQLSLKSG